MSKSFFFVFVLIALGGCSKGADGPKRAADVNANIDQQIADVKARTDIPEMAKADILKRLSRGRRASAPAPPAGVKG